MATAYLLELIIQMTDAKTDQDHLRVALLNNPQVPDRTAHILDNTQPSPLPVLRRMAQTLEGLGDVYKRQVLVFCPILWYSKWRYALPARWAGQAKGCAFLETGIFPPQKPIFPDIEAQYFG